MSKKGGHGETTLSHYTEGESTLKKKNPVQTLMQYIHTLGNLKIMAVLCSPKIISRRKTHNISAQTGPSSSMFQACILGYFFNKN